jgi:ribulose-phosphate 3-epimerase
MVKIIPAILTNSISEIEEKVSLIEGTLDSVQIDIIDGVYASNKTVDPSALEVIDTDVNIDFHLMTKNPVDWVEKCVTGGAERIIGQIELMDSQIDFVEKVTEVGAKVGLALNIDTPITKIAPEVLNSIDVVLVMGYSAGFGGQPLNPKALEKMKELKTLKQKANLTFTISLDGGVNLGNIKSIVEAGADEVAIGSLFNGDLKDNVNRYQTIISKE